MTWAWYTKGRRLPTLIGKDVSGRRIPGGPYTGLQAVTVLIVPACAWWSRGLWAASMGGLTMLGTIVLITVAAVKVIGKADFASRNPVLLLSSYLRQIRRPMSGTLAGRKLVEPRPHHVTCRADVTHSQLGPIATGTEDREPTIPDAAVVSVTEQKGSVKQAGSVEAALDPDPISESRPKATKAPVETVGALDAADDGWTAVLHPPSPPAPDRRRSGLEAFLAGASHRKAALVDEDAA